MAPQLTATKGPAARWLHSCTARATSSLPVPDSPWMSTGAMLVATFSIRALIWPMTVEDPTMRARAWIPPGGGGAVCSDVPWRPFAPSGPLPGNWRWLCSASTTAARS